MNDQARRGGEHAHPILPAFGRHRPSRLSGEGIDGAQFAAIWLILHPLHFGQLFHLFPDRGRQGRQHGLQLRGEDERRLDVECLGPTRFRRGAGGHGEHQVPHVQHGGIIVFAFGIIGGGIPVARACRGREDEARAVPEIGAVRRHLRHAVFVEPLGPVGPHQRIDAQRLAGFAVQHEEIAVLGRVEDDRADLSIHLHLRQHHRLGGGEVPAVAGRFLIMPLHSAALGIQRDDRGEIEVGAALGRAGCDRIGAAIADPDIHGAELGIIVDRIPDGAAAADIPTAFGVPGLERGVERLVLLRPLRRIMRDGVEAPRLRAVGDAIGGDVSARVIFRAGIAENDEVAGHFRRARAGIAAAVIDHRVDLPDDLPALRVERVEHAVERTDHHLVLGERDAAIGLITARGPVRLHVHLRLEGPERLAGRGVERIDAAEIAAGVHHPVDHHRRRFLHAVGVEVVGPGQAEPGGIALVDIGQAGMMAAPDVAAGIGPVVTSAAAAVRSATGAGRKRQQAGQYNQRLFHAVDHSNAVLHRGQLSLCASITSRRLLGLLPVIFSTQSVFNAK